MQVQLKLFKNDYVHFRFKRFKYVKMFTYVQYRIMLIIYTNIKWLETFGKCERKYCGKVDHPMYIVNGKKQQTYEYLKIINKTCEFKKCYFLLSDTIKTKAADF